MTADLDDAPVIAPAAPEEVDGNTTAVAVHSSEAFLVACVLAEHVNPLFLLDAAPEFVEHVLSNQLSGSHARILAWRTRLTCTAGEWRVRWGLACKAVALFRSDLLPEGTALPDYDTAVFSVVPTLSS